jgi:predicted metalloendopeptidase
VKPHLLVAAACAAATHLSGPATADTPAASGIDRAGIDAATRAQDDLFRHVNGRWIDATEIPSDLPAFGGFEKLEEESKAQLRAILESDAPPGDRDAKLVRDLYRSFVDEGRLQPQGLAPLDPVLARIDALKDRAGLPALLAELQKIGVVVPFAAYVHLDNRVPGRYVYDLRQDGLGMPDRDYYLQGDDALVKIRREFRSHVATTLALTGVPAGHAKRQADTVLAIESALAKAQWTKVENRDPVKIYNRVPVEQLAKDAPGFDWRAYLAAAGVPASVDAVNVGQPSYLKEFARLARTRSVDDWKTYLRWHVVSAYSPLLSKPFEEAQFRFYGTVLQGVPENRPRWKRGVEFVDQMAGEALGREYVAKHFPPESKARVEKLVRNLLATFRHDLEGLDWMGPATKQEARAKLDAFAVKIGYPDKWRDYSALEARPDDLVGNAMRGHRFEFERNVAKLGRPVDRTEWDMTPPTVNAYYNPEMNEIVFPAAILQPPFFDPAAEDAVNYGAIGAVIGHEISHGFDDEGSQYDGTGALRNWWTEADQKTFREKTKALVAEYGAFEPVPGFHANGELTLGENIADNSGLSVAHDAYLLSLGGRESPVIDGLTGAQRFYMGWAQVWRWKARQEYMIQLIKSDPHSMNGDRVNGAVVNQPGFYEAFGVKPGDKLWREPKDRVRIW